MQNPRSVEQKIQRIHPNYEKYPHQNQAKEVSLIQITPVSIKIITA
jgi:hypothetical protein